jgi:hypothetical protein
MDSIVKASLELLGLRGKDKVTGFDGVVGSVCFDAYGCVQVLITPPAKEGKIGESYWFDVKRVEVDTKDRVLPAPAFMSMKQGDEPGGNALPQPSSMPAPY